MAGGPHTKLGRVGAATIVAAGVLVPAATAAAADYPSGGSPQGVEIGSAEVRAKTVTNSSTTLPFTGGDVTGLVAIGAGCALTGAVLVRRSRRRAPVA
jgi:hypothetical protein